MSGQPKRQHTVPCSYLRWFSNNPYEWDNGRSSIVYTYDIKEEKWMYRSVDSATIQKDIYTLVDKEWSKSYFVEDFLGERIEKIAHIIEKIDKKENLQQSEIEQLALFITFQEMRSQSRREIDKSNDEDLLKHILNSCFSHCNNQTDLEQSIANSVATYFPDCKLECSIQDVIEKFPKGEKISLNTQNRSIRNMMAMAPEMAKLLIMRPWLIMHISGTRSFITSDYPLYLDWERNAIYSPGYGTADHIEMALSKKSYLIMYSPFDKGLDFHWKEPHTVKNIYQDVVDPKLIRLMNYATAYATNRRLIGNDKELVESIHKTIKKLDEDYKNKKSRGG